MTKKNRWDQFKRIVKFFSLQSLIQLSEGLAGILIIRFLTKLDYSIYTLANSILTSLNTLSELGVSSKVLSIGGKVWEDKAEMTRLLAAYNYLRGRMALFASLVILPIMFYLFRQNGFSIGVFLLCVALCGLTFWYLFLYRGYRLVLLLNNEVFQVQRPLLITAAVRLGLVFLLGLLFFNFWVALVLTLLMNVGNYFLLRKRAQPFIQLQVSQPEKYQGEFQQFVQRQIPYYSYIVLQGQITVLLITFFGETSMLADFGAVTRITLAVTLLNAYLTSVVYPNMVKIRIRQAFVRTYIRYFALIVGLGVALVVGIYLLQDVYIWIIGNQYENVKPFLPLMTLVVAVRMLLSLVYGVNYAKGWIEQTWVIIPVTIISQVAFIFLLDLSTLEGILLFNLITELPNLLVNGVFSFQGIAKFD